MYASSRQVARSVSRSRGPGGESGLGGGGVRVGQRRARGGEEQPPAFQGTDGSPGENRQDQQGKADEEGGQRETGGAQHQEHHEEGYADEHTAQQVGHRARRVPYDRSDHGVTVGGGGGRRPYAQGVFRR